MVGRAGKPTAGGRMGTAERNKTLPPDASLRATTALRLSNVIGITGLCLSYVISCHVILVTLAKCNSAPC